MGLSRHREENYPVMVRQSYLLMTRRQEVNEIVEFLFSPQNTLYCISEKLAHTEVILPRALKKKNKHKKMSRSNRLWKSSCTCHYCFAKQTLKYPSGSSRGQRRLACEGEWQGVVRGSRFCCCCHCTSSVMMAPRQRGNSSCLSSIIWHST